MKLALSGADASAERVGSRVLPRRMRRTFGQETMLYGSFASGRVEASSRNERIDDMQAGRATYIERFLNDDDDADVIDLSTNFVE